MSGLPESGHGWTIYEYMPELDAARRSRALSRAATTAPPARRRHCRGLVTMPISARACSQAILRRRRHQARRPQLAKISPDSPAPAMGPGTRDQHAHAISMPESNRLMEYMSNVRRWSRIARAMARLTSCTVCRTPKRFALDSGLAC